MLNTPKEFDMWTFENIPLEMKDLDPRVKEKAIEIANRLQSEGEVEENVIIPQAIKIAEEWFYDMEG